MDTGRVPRTEEIAQPTTGVHDARDHRIKAVGSLPVASSSAACLVLTTCHPCAGCAQACSSFMISATLPGGLGIPKRAAGFSLGLVLFFPPAIPGRSVVGSGLLGKLGPHLKATFPGAWGSEQEGRGQGMEWRCLEMPFASLDPFARVYARARASCRCVFMRKGPDIVRWQHGRAQPCIRRVGVKAAVEQDGSG